MLASLSSLALFILHVTFILACAVSLQPVDRAAQVRPGPEIVSNQRRSLPSCPRSLSRQLLAYSAAVRLSLVVHALRLARRCPLPRSLSEVPRFVQEAGGTTESFYLFGSFILLSNPSGSLILASQALLAVYHALSYGRSLGPLAKPVQRLARMAAAHRENVLFAMGFLDIMAFVQLTFYALTGGAGIRGLVQSFIYLNLVKNRSASNSPETYASSLASSSLCSPILSITRCLSASLHPCLSLAASHSLLSRPIAGSSYYSPVWNAIGRSAVGAAAKRVPFFESVRRWFRSGAAVA